MTINLIPGQDSSNSKKQSKSLREEKPLVREYIKTSDCKDGTLFVVEKCKLTMNGWLLIETTDWVGFINGKAAVAITLMEELAPKLHGEFANALVAVIHKKSKFGFVLGTNDEQKLWYHHTPDAETLEIYEVQPEHFLLPTGVLTIEDFLGTQSLSSKSVGAENQNKSKAKKQDNG